MFGFKKKGRARAHKIHTFLHHFITPLFLRCGKTFRISARKRIANKWARKHPKAFMTYYCVFAILIFSITLISDFSGIKKSKEQNPLDIESIVPINNRLKYLNESEANIQMLKAEIAEMGRKGQVLYNEMDSLMRVEHKTHRDSTRIKDIYTNLNITFNNKRNESKKH